MVTQDSRIMRNTMERPLIDDCPDHLAMLVDQIGAGASVVGRLDVALTSQS